MGAISALQQQVQSLQMELNAVRTEILRFKFREEASNIFPSSHVPLLSSVAVPNHAAPPAPPPPPSPQQPPPTAPPTSSSSPLYTQLITSAGDYSTIISNENISYFG